MTVESLAGLLQQHPFLQDLSARHVETLVGCASNRRFAAGEYLAREGEAADHLFLLREGQVSLEIRVPQEGGLRVETVHEGDTLGWSAFLEPFRWGLDARAVTPVRAIALDATCLRRKLEEDHEFGFQLLRRIAGRMAARLRATRMQLMDIYGGESPRRRVQRARR
jgi:CRP-like cAMP-binding protein